MFEWEDRLKSSGMQFLDQDVLQFEKVHGLVWWTIEGQSHWHAWGAVLSNPFFLVETEHGCIEVQCPNQIIKRNRPLCCLEKDWLHIGYFLRHCVFDGRIYIYIYYRWNYLEFPFQSLKRSQMDLNGKLNGTPTLMSFDLGCLNLLEGQ